eukprot:TRINITY_DN13489_c0_g1_i1.p2 TRINITY_DN13489_c0_g1~~TRINITY_DN13489_c0_g1_i1.p2  ORF type:complete len:274 (-),score=33.76 TRINITY_DN13489_c0_g1_i1:66-842(-)
MSRPCRFFNQEAGCRDGDHCKYQHVANAPSAAQTASFGKTAPFKVCKYFNTDAGCVSETCTFAHISQAQKATTAAAPAVAGEKQRPCRFFNSEAGCRDGENCKYPHVKAAPAAPAPRPRASEEKSGEKKACKFFRSEKGCKLGDTCPYPHTAAAAPSQPKPAQAAPKQPRAPVAQTATPVATDAAESDKPRRAPRARAPKGDSTRPCRFFNSPAGCRETECAYPHTKTEQRPLRPCRFVKTEGGCRDGDQCPFPHTSA